MAAEERQPDQYQSSEEYMIDQVEAFKKQLSQVENKIDRVLTILEGKQPQPAIPARQPPLRPRVDLTALGLGEQVVIETKVDGKRIIRPKGFIHPIEEWKRINEILRRNGFVYIRDPADKKRARWEEQ